MPYLAFALCWMTGIAAGTFLVVQGHPWFAAGMLVASAGLSLTHGDMAGREKEQLPLGRAIAVVEQMTLRPPAVGGSIKDQVLAALRAERDKEPQP